MQKDSLCLAALDEGKDRGPSRGFEEDGEEEDMFEAEFRQYKRTYYMTKMGVEVVSELVYLTFSQCLPQHSPNIFLQPRAILKCS